MNTSTSRPRGNKGRSAPAEHCVLCPERLYRWPGAVSAHTGLGVPKLRALRRQHPFPVSKLGETLFVRGATVIKAIEAAAEPDGDGQASTTNEKEAANQ